MILMNCQVMLERALPHSFAKASYRLIQEGEKENKDVMDTANKTGP